MKAPQDIILKPMITEQSVDNMQQSKYTFKVAKDANKIEIAQAAAVAAAALTAGIDPAATVNCTGKTKRVGRFTGKKADFKKAIITINPETTKTGKDGKKLKTSIEFFDGMF